MSLLHDSTTRAHVIASWVVFAAVGGCAPPPLVAPAPPATIVMPPQPQVQGTQQPAPVQAPAVPSVWLLVLQPHPHAWVRCAAETAGSAAVCTPIDALQGARLMQLDRNEYLVRDSAGGASSVWNAATGQKQPITAPAGGIEFRLRDGTLVSFDYTPNYTRVLTSKGGPWSPVATHERLRSLDARPLPDGKVLFKSAPGMGGPESPHFVDLLIGKPTHLYVADTLGGKARRLASGPQFMHADLVDSGRYAAYFSPGDVDQAANTRSFSVQAIEVSTSLVKHLSTVKMPVSVQRAAGKAWMRGAPDSVAFPLDPWFLHGMDHDSNGRALTHRLQNVVDGTSVDLDAARLGELMAPLPTGTLSIGSMRRWSAHVVVRVGPELRVLALPSLETVLRARVDGAAADVIVP